MRKIEVVGDNALDRSDMEFLEELDFDSKIIDGVPFVYISDRSLSIVLPRRHAKEAFEKATAGIDLQVSPINSLEKLLLPDVEKIHMEAITAIGDVDNIRVVTLPKPPENAVLVDVDPPTWMQFGSGWLLFTHGAFWGKGEMDETDNGLFGWEHDEIDDQWIVRIAYGAGFVGGLFKFKDGKLVDIERAFDEKTIVDVGRGVRRYTVTREDGVIRRRFWATNLQYFAREIEEELIEFEEVSIKDKNGNMKKVYMPKYYMYPAVGGILL